MVEFLKSKYLMKKILQLSLLLSLAIFLWGCPSGAKKVTTPVYLKHTKTLEEMVEIHNKFDRFKYQIIGHFSNREQVEKEGIGEAVQEFIVAPIFHERPGEFWVYLEFFSPSILDRPLDQRIEQYVKLERDTFRMEVYYLKNPEKWINEWKKEKPFADFDMKRELIRDENCDLIIAGQEDKPGSFRTLPPAEITCDMKTSTNQAKYVDLEFELSDAGYLMWFKFYDINKRRLKVTDDPGLSFKRLDYKAADYKDLSKSEDEDE